MSPSLTAWPSSTLISLTTPASSASTGISIFIDSRITTVSPSSTESPGETSIFQTVPVMCASISAKLPSSRIGSQVARQNTRAVTAETSCAAERVVIVTARDEADRIAGDARARCGRRFPDARIVLAESGSRDATAALAERAGAEVVQTRVAAQGKGALDDDRRARGACGAGGGAGATFLLCDGDLGASAARLGPLVEAVEAGRVRSRRCRLRAPGRRAASGSRSGSRAGRSGDLTGRRDAGADLRPAGAAGRRRSSACCRSPTASGWRPAMTVDALRAGLRLEEVEIDLEHRATTRSIGGLPPSRRASSRDFVRIYLSRRVRPALGSASMILAIDQGTTGTTCLVFDERGAPGRARVPRVRAALSRSPAGSSTTPRRSGR